MIMEIKKSYELRRVEDQLVLSQMSAPDFVMKTVLVADELISLMRGKVIPGSVDGYLFFVLRQGKELILCLEKGHQLQIMRGCDDFSIFSENLLLKRGETWFWWNSLDMNKELITLGSQILSVVPTFILKEGRCSYLVYFEKGKGFVKSEPCLSYEMLCDGEIHTNHLLDKELFVDVLRLDTFNGSLFVSIEKETGPSYHHMEGSTEGAVSYRFVFNKEASVELLSFTDFVNKICKELSEQGFSVPTSSMGSKNFTPGEIKRRMGSDVIVSAKLGLSRLLSAEVLVDVNLSKLYRKENEAYMVKCVKLEYFKRADAVRVEKTPQECALYVTSDGVTDKIYCAGDAHLLNGAPLNIKRGV